MAGAVIEENLAELDQLLADVAARLTAPERRKLGQDLATELRKRNADRIGKNATPTGEAMLPRKKRELPKLRDQMGSARTIKRGKMFLRAKAPRYLRKGADIGEAWVGFTGAMARIMRVHQLGLVDATSHEPGSPRVKYEAREVLGIPDADREAVLEIVTRHLGA